MTQRRTRKTLRQRLDEGQNLPKAMNNNIKARTQQKYRLTARITEIAQGDNVYFLTFTINEQNYGHDTEYYVKGIKKVLFKACEQYILNEDYGTLNERLHFHAIVKTHTPIVIEYVKGSNYWKDCPYLLGHVHVASVNLADERSTPKIKEYILKTYNHTVKNTTGNIYYSRRKKPQ
jgi:hypothetical protein